MKNGTCSRVAAVLCPDYEEEKVYRAIRAGLAALGGLEAFLKPEEKILVKPNFLYPSEASRAVTTHPSVIGGFLRILQEEGFGRVLVGDSPANGSCKAALQKLHFDGSSLHGAQIADMDEEVTVSFPEGKICRKFYFAKEVTEADAIVGLCKMKTHMLERITGAVKNMYGLTCGYRKAAGHVRFSTAVKFAKMLCDTHRATPQRLHIMDGIVAMEGNGPASGVPTQMGVLLLSSDPVALDTVFCRLADLSPELVPTNVWGNFYGIGSDDPKEIRIIRLEEDGSSSEGLLDSGILDDLVKKDFDVRREKESTNVLTLLSRATGGQRKPVIDRSLCVKCGVCVDHCPVQAVSFRNGREAPPEYNYKKCIRCYCCQELCPRKAISVK